MEFIQKDPSDDLSVYINKFMVVRNDNDSAENFESEIVPTGFHYLNYGRGEALIYHHPNHSRKLENGILLNGMIRKSKVALEMEPPFYIINCELKPTTAYYLLNEPVDAYTDRYVKLEEIIGKIKARDLYASITETTDDDKCIWLLESFLREQLPSSLPDHYVDQAVGLIDEAKGKKPVSQIAEEVNIGVRQLQKKFKKMVGVSPNYYSNLIQFVSTLRIYENNPEIPLQDLAYHGGYYDLPHMLKAFKKFSGAWPSKYKGLEKRYVEEIL